MSRALPDVWLRGAYHVWRRNLTVYGKTYKMNILPNFFEPIFYLSAMGLGVGAYVGQSMGGRSYLEFITPGLIAASSMNGATFETTYNVFVKMHFGRTYHAITSTPVNIEDAMLGEVFWAMTRGILYGAAFGIVVAFFGLLPGLSSLLILPVIVLTSLVFAAVGLWFTSLIKVIDLYSFYYTLFLTPMFLFSGIFFPFDSMPHWAKIVAWILPLSHCVVLAKGAVNGGLPIPAVLGEFAWILLASGLFLSFAIARIRRFYRS